VKAAQLLKYSHPEIFFLIVGGKHHQETEEYYKITSLINEFKLQERVYIIGPRKDVEDIINFCDIFVMPSVVEGFGLSLAEAMSAERLVIASDIEPFKEIVDDGIDGFLFEAKDYNALAKAIEKILKLDSKDLLKIAENGRRKILERFSSKVMVNKYEELYSS
jgi:glycosyltransferase involved in cell wall biosynthesis